MSLPAQPLSANCPRRREQSHLFLRGSLKGLSSMLCVCYRRDQEGRAQREATVLSGRISSATLGNRKRPAASSMTFNWQV